MTTGEDKAKILDYSQIKYESVTIAPEQIRPITPPFCAMCLQTGGTVAVQCRACNFESSPKTAWCILQKWDIWIGPVVEFQNKLKKELAVNATCEKWVELQHMPSHRKYKHPLFL